MVRATAYTRWWNSGHAVHVERDGRQVDGVALEEGDDAVDGGLDGGRKGRRRFARGGEAPTHARSQLALARLGELDADDALIAPGNGAGADGGFENRKGLGRGHRQILCLDHVI